MDNEKDIAYLDYERGLQDPVYLIQKYFRTLDLTQNKYVPFMLFPRQLEFVNNLRRHRFNIADKPRQAGVSVTAAAYAAVELLLSDPDMPQKVLICANKLKLAKEFLKKIKFFLEQFPPFLWGDKYDHTKTIDGHIVGKGSTEKLTLVNGAEVIAFATSPDALRGYTPTLLIIDEAAFVENGADMYTAAMAATATGGKMILISTPNGHDELYYKVHNGAKSKKNNFHITEFRWHEDPRYNKDLVWLKRGVDGEEISIKEKNFTKESYDKMFAEGYKPSSSWYMEMCRGLNMDKKAIASELDVKFEGSGGNVIEYEHIDYHKEKFVREPISIEGDDKNLWVWARATESGKYGIGVDVSSGNADDYSAIQVIDLNTGEQVAEYKGKIRPEHLATMVLNLGRTYNNALVVVDATGGYGDIVIWEMQKANYSNLYKSRKNRNKMNEIGDAIAGLKIGMDRPKIISKFISKIESYAVQLRSIRSVVELETYVWKNGRADHLAGYNDDLIMALAILLYVVDVDMALQLNEIERANAVIDYITKYGIKF